MKTIGIIGGRSWEGSAEYYKLINKEVIERLGAQHSARIAMFSVDYHEVEGLQTVGNWDELTRMVTDVAKLVEQSGAKMIIIASSTLHKVADQVQKHISIPIFHIVDALGLKLQKESFKKLGLIGSKITMEHDFYADRLQEKFGIQLIVPNEKDREETNRILVDELAVGEIKEQSKNYFLQIIEEMKKQGAEAIVMASTEMSTFIDYHEASLPVFDTTSIHAKMTVNLALED